MIQFVCLLCMFASFASFDTGMPLCFSSAAICLQLCLQLCVVHGWDAIFKELG